jgi:hypothetical protein
MGVTRDPSLEEPLMAQGASSLQESCCPVQLEVRT